MTLELPMTSCEMCGSEKPLFTAQIEGSMLSVCENCARFGKVIAKPKPVIPLQMKRAALLSPKTTPPEAPRELIVANYAQLIHQAREKLSMTQKDFAMHVNERESLIAKFEGGKMEPPLDTARKLEHLLKIKLIEQHTDEDVKVIKSLKGKSAGGLTIGDVIKV